MYVVRVVSFRLSLTSRTDNEFTQLMKGLQGERLRQAFKYLDKDQDGYIRPEQFKKIILVCLLPTRVARLILTIALQDIAAHKLSDAVIERLPTLTTLSPGGRISYSEVNAFYNVIRGAPRTDSLGARWLTRPQRWIWWSGAPPTILRGLCHVLTDV